MKKLYITTAIPYANGDPHLGHAMDYLLADTLRRYYDALGIEVRLQAGTDEHGNKIYKKALSAGLSAQELADQNSKKFSDFIESLGVGYTDFIRTTDKKHVESCQKIWGKISDHIYKDNYEGWYCEGCESFVSDKEYEDNHGICPDHQTEYTRITEENYYLRIADFKERIRDAISSDRMKIVPVARKNEFLNLLEDMPDVSISRPKSQVPWGIPVPGDSEQVMYVWVDALTNYITVLGYPEKDISDNWPANTQVVGKDIMRFHAGIWSAILLALGLELPKNLLVHGFITIDGQKMSKSIGNVITPEEILARHGLDAFKYYFLRHASSTEDIDFSWEKYESAYLELANDLGNLVQRLSVLCAKNDVSGQSEVDIEFSPEFREKIEEYKFNAAFDCAWSEIQALNKRIDFEKPWALAKESPEKAKSVLESMVEELLSTNQMLKIFIPDTAEKIDAIFGAEKIQPPEKPLFIKNH